MKRRSTYIVTMFCIAALLVQVISAQNSTTSTATPSLDESAELQKRIDQLKKTDGI